MTDQSNVIAIVGMAGRFPGAAGVQELWELLCDAREGIVQLDDAQLARAGVSAELRADPHYVRARGVLDGVELFDAEFFGMSAREAALTDPQHRLFLETAWEAIEHAGYDVSRLTMPVGVFAGSAGEGYLRHHVSPAGQPIDGLAGLETSIGNDRDYLTTRVAYRLDLRGPCLTVQTACSTSLVAVQLACQSLLGYQCDVALAGGVSLAFPLNQGYLHQPGHILSPDGHCRAFDAQARGPVPGDAVGVVVLKRLADALNDGDHIHAVILAAATNNDGSSKAGYSAPGVQGQAEVVELAHAIAGVSARSIGYVEAHGTGTPLGDPVEIAALTQAFGATTTERGFCAVGSLKSNLGHLNTAAGVASLIKATLAVEHAEIPASLHFEQPNPAIGFDQTPFFVSARKQPWPEAQPSGAPRRAGVSSFGIGGTNAHVVLEEAPAPYCDPPDHDWQLLVVSARSAAALDAACRRLAVHLEQTAPDATELANVAYTLQVGRKAFSHRRALVCRDAFDAARRLAAATDVHVHDGSTPQVCFVFPGQGAQRSGMGQQLFAEEPVFRELVERASQLLGVDLLALYADSTRLEETAVAQPALFTFCYALARVWLSWGVAPAQLIGHSLGEWVCACLAGVFDFDDALGLVAERGRLMGSLPAGAMLAVPVAAEELETRLPNDVVVAAYNAPNSCVLAGSEAAIAELGRELAHQGVSSQRLSVMHAFHSPSIDPIVPRFVEAVARVPRQAPSLPWISNVTGAPITTEQALDPSYWGRQMREPVRFGDGVARLAAAPNRILLEVGPGRTLEALTRGLGATTICSLSPGSEEPEPARLQLTLGQLWCHGVNVDWSGVHSGRRRLRCPLPSYPFERKRHWLERPEATADPLGVEAMRLLETELQTRLRIRPLESYAGLSAGLTELCASQLLAYFKRGGVEWVRGRVEQREALRDRLGVLPKFHKLFDFLLDTLAASGALRWGAQPGELHVLRDDFAAPSELQQQLVERHPEFLGLIELLGHCISHYPDALSGRIDAISVLYPGGSAERITRAERQTVVHRSEGIYLALLQEYVLRLLAARPQARLRILEVGGGSGLLTWPLVNALAQAERDRVAFHFTDVGRVFVDDARREASARGLDDMMSFGLLDLSKDPKLQGQPEQCYDLVLGFNVVHAVPNVPQALDHLCRLMAPGGTLALVEALRMAPWDVLIWGLAEGFWYFDDALRTTQPLLPIDTWQAAFREQGLERVEAYPSDTASSQAVDHGLILGRASAVARARAIPLANSGATHDAPRAATPQLGLRQPRPALSTPYVAPRSALERTLVELCEELVSIDGVGVRDDLLELGADSLVTLRFADQIRSRLGREPPAHSMFRGASVESMARALSSPEESLEASSLVVPIQSSGSKPPFFFVHPVLGVTLAYVGLAREMGADQPFYGIQALGLDGQTQPEQTIEAAAARYIEAMREIAPQGPYYLGGYSFGCSIAFEMAQQLSRGSEDVALLALVDGPAPVPGFRPTLASLTKLLEGFVRSMPFFHDYFYLANAAKTRQRPTDDGVLSRLLASALIANFVPQDSLLLTLRQPEVMPMFRILIHHIKQARRYAPERYAGRITFVKAIDPGAKPLRASQASMGWERLAAGEFERHEVPGEHVAMLRPPLVRHLAETLSDCLRRAERERTSSRTPKKGDPSCLHHRSKPTLQVRRSITS